jgi:hypothetical protein
MTNDYGTLVSGTLDCRVPVLIAVMVSYGPMVILEILIYILYSELGTKYRARCVDGNIPVLSKLVSCAVCKV